MANPAAAVPAAAGVGAGHVNVPNLAAILQGMNQQNAAINQQRADSYAEQNRVREKKEWIDRESRKIERCEGLPEKSMRQWVRAMLGAMTRIPQLQNAALNAPQLQQMQQAVDRQLGHDSCRTFDKGS